MRLIALIGCALIAAVVLFKTGLVGGYYARSVALPVVKGVVDLTPLGDDWQRLCVLTPYEGNKTAREVTGQSIDVESRSKIARYDDIALLITLYPEGSGRKPKLFEVPRRPSDFADVGNGCWPRGTQFRVPPQGHPTVFVE